MRVESLTISYFRNMEGIRLFPCGGANIIFGGNAQGKTNLIEAIWLFSGAKSFRGSKDGDFTMFGNDISKLELTFFTKGREQSSAIILSGDKKNVFLNEIKQESITKLAGEFCAVVFSPDHLSLVKQGPDKRRRLIDVSLSQAYPKYMKILDGYNRALRQRNTLLKDIAGHPALEDTLDTWDKSLAGYGAYIIHMRQRYVKKLALLASDFYSGISSGKEAFSATYAPGFDIGIDGKSREEIHNALETALFKNRGADIHHGVTSLGPHRDDMEIMVNGVSARAFGSQGQQRSCILALKLAECAILEERNNEPPVILLDDVMSELDESRRDFLLNQLHDRQVFITCCDAEAFSGLKHGKVFEISKGSIVNQQ